MRLTYEELYRQTLSACKALKSVAALRARLGLSVREFALELGVTAASVYRWESSEALSLRPKTREALEGLAAESS